MPANPRQLANLLVPHLHTDLACDLPVPEVTDDRGEHSTAIRVFADLVEGKAILTDHLIADLVGHIPTAVVAHDWLDARLSLEPHGGRGRPVLVVAQHHSVFAVELEHVVGVPRLKGASKQLECPLGSCHGHTGWRAPKLTPNYAQGAPVSRVSSARSSSGATERTV